MLHTSDSRGWFGCISQTLDHSPFYACVATHIQSDPVMQNLLSLVDSDQPNLVLFCSTVNFLVLNEPDSELAQFYPYLNREPRNPDEVYPYFRRFCLEHADVLAQLLPGSRLQTNEVRRCANLVPAFHRVYALGGGKPLMTIELGCSGGLNLNWNQYCYTYKHSRDVTSGDPLSPVQIYCQVEADDFPALPQELPSTSRKMGIEMFPLDITRERDVRWLRACIWPEEIERYGLLDTAIQFARQTTPQVLSGDACDLLPQLLEAASSEETICIYHSFALNQGPAYVRERIEQCILETSRRQPVYRISLEVEPPHQTLPQLEIFTYQQGMCVEFVHLATCALHGERMVWH